MKILKMCSLLLILFLIGCSSESVLTVPMEFQTKDEFLDYLMGGYLEGSESLYVVDERGGRLQELCRVLGLDNCDGNGIYAVNKGGLLLFDKYEENRDPNKFYTLVLSADAPPKLMRSPEGLWDGECRVFHYTEKEGLQCLDKEKFKRWSNPPIHFALNEVEGEDESLKFYNGHVIAGHYAMYMDEDAKFLVYRNLDKPLTQSLRGYIAYESEPIYITSIDNPNMKIRSSLEWFPESMAVNNHRLYLGAATWRKAQPLFHFEVFDIIGDNELRYLKDYYVDVPWSFAVDSGYVCSYDYRTNSQIIFVYRKPPFFNDQYLYNYDDNCLKKIPGKFFVFIDPAILKNSVQYVDLEKLRAN